MNRLKRILSFIALIISVLGLITFSLFIFEESLQVTMFGTWPAQDAGDWDLVLEGIDLMEAQNKGMKIVLYSVGWLQPLAFFSYRSYAKSTDFYIKSLKAKAFARAPEAFHGKTVEFNFTPTRVMKEPGVIKLINRNIIVLVDKEPRYMRLHIKGKVRVEGRIIFIDPLDLTPVFSQK